ncbi:MAG TPA: sigma-70 family RNA polymerase sigma factor [Bryobacteraceae bacterium]|nr:sigma-70 family RNA polymerase sigma factor [Bryobacteraceae bacterium]
MELDGALTMPLAQQRESDADFERLVELNQRRVLALAWRITGNLADAEDIAQDVFWKLHQNLSSIGNEGVVRWLQRVTVNACTDAVRRRRNSDHAWLELVPDKASTPEQAAVEREREARLQRALGGLGQRERAALVLRDLEGLSTAEVAALLGTSEVTIRVQISKARVKLRELLRGEV